MVKRRRTREPGAPAAVSALTRGAVVSIAAGVAIGGVVTGCATTGVGAAWSSVKRAEGMKDANSTSSQRGDMPQWTFSQPAKADPGAAVAVKATWMSAR